MTAKQQKNPSKIKRIGAIWLDKEDKGSKSRQQLGNKNTKRNSEFYKIEEGRRSQNISEKPA